MQVRGLLFFLLGSAGLAAAPSLELGRRIYHEGVGADGRTLTARSGVDATALPAAFVACMNCHGVDGRGKTEAGVTAVDIRWDNLAKPYGAALASGRRRPAYEARSFERALTQGVDAAGQALDAAMPRYALTTEEASALLGYLAHIGRERAEGVTDAAIVLGLRVTADERGELALRVLNAWSEEVNGAGGIYRRRVQFVGFGANESPPVFAVLSADLTDAGSAAMLELAQRGVPVLVAGRAPDGGKARALFSLYPGREDEARVLALAGKGSVRATLPRDATPQGLAEYRAFAARQAVPPYELEFQFALLAAAKLHVEALKNAGRELTRENFVAALEGLSNVQTGLTPPLGFTPRRHVATGGVYVVRGDPASAEAEAEWVRIE